MPSSPGVRGLLPGVEEDAGVPHDGGHGSPITETEFIQGMCSSNANNAHTNDNSAKKIIIQSN